MSIIHQHRQDDSSVSQRTLVIGVQSAQCDPCVFHWDWFHPQILRRNITDIARTCLSQAGAIVNHLAEMCRLLNTETRCILQRINSTSDSAGNGRLVDGIWTGGINLTLEQEIDCVYADETAERARVLRFVNFEHLTVVAISDFPERRKLGLTSLLVFNSQVWQFIFGSLILLALSLTLSGGRSWRALANSMAEVLLNCIQMTWGLSKTRTKGGNLLLLVWRIAAMLLIASYSSGLLATLVSEIIEYPFRDQQTLLECFRSGRCRDDTSPLHSAYGIYRDPDKFREFARVLRKADSDSSDNTASKKRQISVFFDTYAQGHMVRDLKTVGHLCARMYVPLQLKLRAGVACHPDSVSPTLMDDMDRISRHLYEHGIVKHHKETDMNFRRLMADHRKCYAPKLESAPIPLLQYAGLVVPASLLLIGALAMLFAEMFAAGNESKKNSKTGHDIATRSTGLSTATVDSNSLFTNNSCRNFKMTRIMNEVAELNFEERRILRQALLATAESSRKSAATPFSKWNSLHSSQYGFQNHSPLSFEV